MRSVKEIRAIRSALRALSPAEISALRSLAYEDYLQSDWWRQRRNIALREAGYRCARCEATRHLQVHHLSYDRLGAEEPSDLQVLCRTCHTGVHFDETQMRIGVYMRIVSSVLAEQALTDLTDIVEESKARCTQHAVPLHLREFQAAVSRLLPRMPYRPPARYANLMVERSTPFQDFTKAEATAYLAALGHEHTIRAVPAVTPAHLADSMTYGEALEDPGGRAEAAEHEMAVRNGRLDEYLRDRNRASEAEESDVAYTLRYVQRVADLVELRRVIAQRKAER